MLPHRRGTHAAHTPYWVGKERGNQRTASKQRDFYLFLSPKVAASHCSASEEAGPLLSAFEEICPSTAKCAKCARPTWLSTEPPEGHFKEFVRDKVGEDFVVPDKGCCMACIQAHKTAGRSVRAKHLSGVTGVVRCSSNHALQKDICVCINSRSSRTRAVSKINSCNVSRRLHNPQCSR